MARKYILSIKKMKTFKIMKKGNLYLLALYSPGF